ncbi:adenosine-deaminase (editase) domain containing protein [Nitzschia inconspicua]|uniref:Adenosine-deaminase (Editase) domain containing protein n=1 Tax=Nitzschia inconspicua TaxID=303405 RepID=A0A9K3LVI0_9STRA|nr:adenosine-deaminase (editase) domain containing protein [Nitzschia inconspicua]
MEAPVLPSIRRLIGKNKKNKKPRRFISIDGITIVAPPESANVNKHFRPKDQPSHHSRNLPQQQQLQQNNTQRQEEGIDIDIHPNQHYGNEKDFLETSTVSSLSAKQTPRLKKNNETGNSYVIPMQVLEPTSLQPAANEMDGRHMTWATTASSAIASGESIESAATVQDNNHGNDHNGLSGSEVNETRQLSNQAECSPQDVDNTNCFTESARSPGSQKCEKASSSKKSITPNATGATAALSTTKKCTAKTQYRDEEVYSGKPKGKIMGREWPEGWIMKSFRRRGGATAGRDDHYWYSPINKIKLRSIREVERFLLAMDAHDGNEDLAKKNMNAFGTVRGNEKRQAAQAGTDMALSQAKKRKIVTEVPQKTKTENLPSRKVFGSSSSRQFLRHLHDCKYNDAKSFCQFLVKAMPTMYNVNFESSLKAADLDVGIGRSRRITLSRCLGLSNEEFESLVSTYLYCCGEPRTFLFLEISAIFLPRGKGGEMVPTVQGFWDEFRGAVVSVNAQQSASGNQQAIEMNNQLHLQQPLIASNVNVAANVAESQDAKPSSSALPADTATKGVAYRLAEKRRVSTCRFADRVAQISVDLYKSIIPVEDRPPQTCLATIVAHDSSDGSLKVVGMGVGTKFLKEAVLNKEKRPSAGEDIPIYGEIVRDMHAEVLARRSFRRALTSEILDNLRGSNGTISPKGILVRSERHFRESLPSIEKSSMIKYKLRPGVTLHLYTSSAPCGNASLKRFCKMTKEKFNDELGQDEWPDTMHDPPHASAIKLGEFSLLLKKDNAGVDVGDSEDSPASNGDELALKVPKGIIPKGKVWPANQLDDWTPPGTTIVQYSGEKGSIHTCSDKICRWNFLGIQGSLLASLLEEPLYVSTVTVGRKLSAAVCKRAICCRLDAPSRSPFMQVMKESVVDVDSCGEVDTYHVNHPAVMGTAVYLDDTGVVETSSETRGQDVRFHSPLTWAWWPTTAASGSTSNNGILECLDGSTGCLFHKDETKSIETRVSGISTRALTSAFHQAYQAATGGEAHNSTVVPYRTMQELRDFKKSHSRAHEQVKEMLLTKHKVLSSWNRRWP